MDNVRWAQIQDVFHEALERPESERRPFLESACRDDAPLMAEVLKMLRADSTGVSLLDRGLPDIACQMLGTAMDSIPSREFGPYRLMEVLGEGGMGEVWLAEQMQPVRRRVAIKLIKVGMDTREVVARFESERQALALMDHPAIAKVFEAGSTSGGRPYFVMEYVAGLPITAYCDKHKLSTRERLELFILVCEGVQHAHQKAIIHRDLKPSNILVTEVEGKPMPRIIDFGVAKATAQRLTAGTMYTRAGSVIGTLGYVSPEQADSGGEDIDTRSDVYSLGAVLYELLVGVLPLDFRKLAFDEILRQLREQDALRPSTKLSTLGGDSTLTAQNRGADLPTLVRQLRGDPDAIVLKALEKDRKRRYSSSSELAADVGRCLRHEPVSAHAPTLRYRTRKYIRRHRLGVAVAGAGVLLLVGFAIVQGVQLQNIRRERDRADRITQFMTGMFKVPDPSEARGNTVTAREILDKSSTDISTGLSNDPELQAKMMYTMANTYFGLGLYSRAESLFKRAMEIQRRVLGPRSSDTLRSMSDLARLLTNEGRYPEAEKLARETLDVQRRVLGSRNPDTLASMSDLARLLTNEGRYAAGEKLYRETLEIQQRILGSEHPSTLQSMSNLAGTLMYEGRYAEAEKLYRETLDIQHRVLGPSSPDALHSMSLLAATLMQEGGYAEADKLYRETLDIQRRVIGPEHPATLNTMSLLAATLMYEGRYAETEKLCRETLDIQRRVLGPEHAQSLYSMSVLAATLMEEGRYAEAEKLSRETLDIQRRVLGPQHPDTLRSLEYVADDLSHEGRYGDAEILFREAIQTAGKASQPGVLADAWYNFACAATTAGHHGEAFEYLGHAIDHGLGGADATATDPDLKSLHGDPRFEALLAKMRQNATAATTQ
ncbi:MAG: tetratricopeptide repeat protein [Acidobacteriaceae bacterium]